MAGLVAGMAAGAAHCAGLAAGGGRPRRVGGRGRRAGASVTDANARVPALNIKHVYVMRKFIRNIRTRYVMRKFIRNILQKQVFSFEGVGNYPSSVAEPEPVLFGRSRCEGLAPAPP